MANETFKELKNLNKMNLNKLLKPDNSDTVQIVWKIQRTNPQDIKWRCTVYFCSKIDGKASVYKLIKVKVDATLRDNTTPIAFSVLSANHIRTDKLCIKRDFRPCLP